VTWMPFRTLMVEYINKWFFFKSRAVSRAVVSVCTGTPPPSYLTSGVSIVQTMVVAHNIASIESHDEYEELRTVRPRSEYTLGAEDAEVGDMVEVPGAEGG
jgi:hypothetical protein